MKDLTPETTARIAREIRISEHLEILNSSIILRIIKDESAESDNGKVQTTIRCVFLVSFHRWSRVFASPLGSLAN